MNKEDIINVFYSFSDIFQQAYKIFVFEHENYFLSEIIIDTEEFKNILQCLKNKKLGIESLNSKGLIKLNNFEEKDFYIDIKFKDEEDFLPKGKIYLKKYIDYLQDITPEYFKSESVSFYDDFCIIDINDYSFFEDKETEKDSISFAIKWYDEKNIKFLYRCSSKI